MITKIRRIAVIEGKPWYVYPEHPAKVLSGETPAFPFVPWTNTDATEAYCLADLQHNGHIVLTESGHVPNLPLGWLCNDWSLPDGWTYSDGHWKMAVVHTYSNGQAIIVAVSL